MKKKQSNKIDKQPGIKNGLLANLDKGEKAALKKGGVNKNLVKRKDVRGYAYYIDKKTGKRAKKDEYTVAKKVLRSEIAKKAKKTRKRQNKWTSVGYVHPSSLDALIIQTLYEINANVFLRLEGETLQIDKNYSYKLIMFLTDIKNAVLEENKDTQGKLISSDFLKFMYYEDLNNQDILIDLTDFIYQDEDFDVMYYFYKHF